MAHLRIETSDGSMPAYEVHPEGAPRGAVLVVQEAFGLTTHIENVVERLAKEGYYAIAPGFFHRQGNPTPIFEYDDIPSVMPAMALLTSEGIRADVSATLEHIAGLGFAQIETAVIGFCMGGSVTFLAAADHRLGAAVTFYGGGLRQGRFGVPGLVELAPELQTPWLGLFGDLDLGIPIEEVEELRTATAASTVDTKIVRYPEGEHGFNCNDRPAVYNEAVATAAWQEMLDWFSAHLPARIA